MQAIQSSKVEYPKREQVEIASPHTIRRVTEFEYQKILSRARTNGSAKEYIHVNGIPYVIGESAERHNLDSKRSGATRYTKDYCEILAAASLAQLYSRGGEAAAFGCHAFLLRFTIKHP